MLIGTILSYLISLAANLRTDAIFARREKRLKAQLGAADKLREAFASARPIREEIRLACAELITNRSQLRLAPKEESLCGLLADEGFQADVTEWLMAGGIEEGAAVKARLVDRMQAALARAGATPEQIAFLKSEYFESLDKAIFASPVLANWRHQLSLNYLREQAAALRQRADEAAGKYSAEKQKAALDRYVECSLAAWDIMVWLPSEADSEVLANVLSGAPDGEILLKRCLIGVLSRFPSPAGLKVILPKAEDPDGAVPRAAVQSLGRLGDRGAIPALTARLDDPDGQVREAAVGALATIRSDMVEKMLLSRSLNFTFPWLDPKEPITETRLAMAARHSGKTPKEVLSLYQSIAADFHLKFPRA
jgi:hypothetical protein